MELIKVKYFPYAGHQIIGDYKNIILINPSGIKGKIVYSHENEYKEHGCSGSESVYKFITEDLELIKLEDGDYKIVV